MVRIESNRMGNILTQVIAFNSLTQQMFEIEDKKPERSRFLNNNFVKDKAAKRQITYPNQRIVLQTIQTENFFKDKKSKSQCHSKQRREERKSIHVAKFMNTARSISIGEYKKQREKSQQMQKGSQLIYTQDKFRQESYLMSNLSTQKSSQLKCGKRNSTKKGEQGQSRDKKRKMWNQKSVPYTWNYALQHYSHYLTKYEQSEIKEYKKIYYIGHKALKREKIDNNSPAFDTEDKEYKFIESDHIGYRYQLLSVIGKGSYGQVFRAFDHKNKQQVALKIIKNEPRFSKQAFIEIKILSHVKEVDHQQQSNVVRIKDFVIFRKHVCILFELLSDNLYELIIRNNYNGLNQQLIRRFAIQILVSLQFLKNQNIIHCDLKPENILLKQYNKSGIKIIDFGSSCFESQTLYTYIQSRYYRAPQITLGIPYTRSIDIWSTGCILTELYTGVPVFPGENEFEQMKYMVDSLGFPPKSLLARGTRRAVFFDEKNQLKSEVKTLKSTLQMFSKPMNQRIDNKDFLSFIESFLKWNPEERISPLQALTHHWIRKGLPQELKTKLSTSNELLKDEKIRKYEDKRRAVSRSKQKSGVTLRLSKKSSFECVKRQLGLKF